MINPEGDCRQDSFIKRLNLFIENLKKSGIQLECVPGLSKQARLNYRQRGNIPASRILLHWSTMFDLNVNWLLLGEGEMLRTPKACSKRGRMPDDEEMTCIQAELVRLRTETYQLQKQLIVAQARIIALQDLGSAKN